MGLPTATNPPLRAAERACGDKAERGRMAAPLSKVLLGQADAPGTNIQNVLSAEHTEFFPPERLGRADVPSCCSLPSSSQSSRGPSFTQSAAGSVASGTPAQVLHSEASLGIRQVQVQQHRLRGSLSKSPGLNFHLF